MKKKMSKAVYIMAEIKANSLNRYVIVISTLWHRWNLELHIGNSLFLVFEMTGLENFLKTVLQRCSEVFHA